MQFQIPQFIEVEDKIFGPLTFRQFVYLAGGAGGAYILWRIFPLFISAPIIAAVCALAAALAFVQYNGRPFILAIEYGFWYLLHPRLYLWDNEHKRTKARATKTDVAIGERTVYIPKLSDSKLHELSWSLDIKERIAAGVGDVEDTYHSGGVLAPVTTAQSALYR